MLVAVLTFLGAMALGAASAMTATITLAATALIAPGTGTHNITTVMPRHTRLRQGRRRDDAGTGVSVYNGTIDGVDIGRSEFRSVGQ
jgi:hypothetical protein